MSAKPQTIDEYLALLSNEKRAALEKLRRAIKSAAPKAEECISYRIPAFRLGGRMLVAFGAAANHCAFYAGAYPVKAHKDELKVYDTSKGTIRFQVDSPLPATLVRKLVTTRIAEYAAQQPAAAHGARAAGKKRIVLK
ncbi:MAG: iron chaperone [Vulcanimicrobiaceae bacterium]